MVASNDPDASSNKRSTPYDSNEIATMVAKKKAKTMLPDIPLTAHYHISWMHRHTITSVAVSIKHGYVISGDSSGVCKFWKRGKVVLPEAPIDSSRKAETRHPCLEFVKAYTAHSSSVRSIVVDDSGDSCVSVSLEESFCLLKFYEIATFDAVSMAKIPIDNSEASTCSCVWFQAEDNQKYVAVALGSSTVIVSPDATIHETLQLHAAPITAMVSMDAAGCILSADRAGTLEVWDCSRGNIASSGSDGNQQSFGGPVSKEHHGIQYTSKTETDLYVLQRKKTWAVALAVCKSTFAVYAADHKVRVFDHCTGICLVTFNEGLSAYEKIYGNFGLDAMSFGKRSATDREIQNESSVFRDHKIQRFQFQFDPTGRYLLLPTMMGIKILDWKKRKMTGMTGKQDADSLRFVGCCLAWGDAVVNNQILLSRGEGGTSRSEDAEAAKLSDALLIGIAYNQRRLYVFSHVDPISEDGPDAISKRDIWNEAPTASDQQFRVDTSATETNQAARAILRTTKGDIHIQLFQQVPKTLENFVGHCKSGYYDDVIFHRVIQGFMLQTGDPLGDGTGGESIWGGEFEDEIVAKLRHDRPFTVSMANAGPNTNGSQFFITTAPTPWLDGKHTVFGRVTRGMDICTAIEKVKTDKNDKPFEDVRILNIDLE